MAHHGLWLPGEHGSTFAHLHLPSAHASARDTGVIIAPPLGHEYTHGYRALRAVASALAGAGFAVMRPDLLGTGNSTEAGPVGVTDWLDDIRRVRKHLLEVEGVQRIVLMGIRTSALLVLEACEPGDALILWNPCASGRAFLREMRAFGKLGSNGAPENMLESGGLVLDTTLRGQIEQLPLNHADRSIGDVLLIERGEHHTDTRLTDLIESRARSLERIGNDEFIDAYREPHNTRIPLQLIDGIRSWLARRFTTGPRTLPRQMIRTGTETILPEPFSGAIERVCTIGGLFAIHTRQPGARCVVLLGNGGSAHHVGANRLNVEIARQLAAEGVDALRYDLSNLGDSVDLQAAFEKNPAGDFETLPEDNYPYPKTTRRDLDKVLRWAEEQGYARIVLAGLCSGAYAVFDQARSAQTRVADELVMINPVSFEWKVGMSLDVPERVGDIMQAKAYQSAIRDWQRWKRLFTGAIEYRRLLRHMSRRISDRISTTWRNGLIALRLRPLPKLASDLLRISQSGAKLRFYFAERDPGREILMTAGARFLAGLERSGSLHLRTFADADHTFKRVRDRDTLVRWIVEDIAGIDGGSETATQRPPALRSATGERITARYAARVG